MRNFVQEGDILSLVNGTGVAIVSGEAMLSGALFGVAQTGVAIGAVGAFKTTGVFTLPKAALAITQGAALYWDDAANNLTTASAGNTLVAKAAVAALLGDTIVAARLG